MQKILLLFMMSLMTYQSGHTKEIEKFCESSECLLVANEVLEMKRVVNGDDVVDYVLNTSRPLLSFMGPEVNKYLCYTGNSIRNLQRILQGLYVNSQIENNQNNRFSLISYHGYTVSDGYVVNLELKSNFSYSSHIYQVHIDYCY